MRHPSSLRSSSFSRWARASVPFATRLRISTAPSGSGWSAFRAAHLHRYRIRRNSRTWRACGSAGTNTNRVCLVFVRGLTQSDLDRVMEYKTLKFGRLQQSALAIDAAPCESRNLSPRTGRYAAAPNLARSPILTDLMHFYRERAHGGRARSFELLSLSRGHYPNDCLDEGKCAAGRVRRGRIIGLVPTMGALHAGAFVADRTSATGNARR